MSTTRPFALLALSAGRQGPELVEHALDWAIDVGGDLVVAFIIDAKVPERVTAQLVDSGFLGEKPSEEFLRALLSEYEDSARTALGQVEVRARERGVHIESVIVVGDFADACLSLIAERQVDRVFLCRQDRSALSRFLFGSAVDEVVRQAPCQVDVLPDSAGYADA
jgi:nucleotide-binding universal stress UspA family protein